MKRLTVSMGIATASGCFLITLISAYPYYLAKGNSEWISCVEEMYPMQREAFTAFVYVPTAWVFACFFFGLTLWNR